MLCVFSYVAAGQNRKMAAERVTSTERAKKFRNLHAVETGAVNSKIGAVSLVGLKI